MMGIKIKLPWRDLYMGIYVKAEKVHRCEICRHRMSPYAADTGDGWEMGWYCPRCDEYYADEDDMLWPFESSYAAAGELKAAGFMIV